MSVSVITPPPERANISRSVIVLTETAILLYSVWSAVLLQRRNMLRESSEEGVRAVVGGE